MNRNGEGCSLLYSVDDDASQCTAEACDECASSWIVGDWVQEVRNETSLGVRKNSEDSDR